MKVSFCVPVYNEQTTIAKTIESLLKQRIKGEILIYDDASTDYSNEILKHYNQIIRDHNKSLDWANPIWCYRTDERKGAAYCRNKLNLIANGDFIAVCDADEYYPNRLEALKETLEQNNDIKFFYSAVNLINETNPHEMFIQEAYKWDLKSKCPISHPSVIYTKALALEYSYKEICLDTDLYEFTLLNMLKSLKENEIMACQDPLMLKREEKSNRNIEKARKLKLDMYKENNIKF